MITKALMQVWEGFLLPKALMGYTSDDKVIAKKRVPGLFGKGFFGHH